MSKKKKVPLLEDNTKLLPILIIPGFMSSGLEIKESSNRGWEGKRLWLNLSSIGISAMYFGKAQKRTIYSDLDDSDEHDEEARQANVKSKWLKHILLDSDQESDPPGIKVRAIPGLEGVDYVTPGPITSHLSYVFGPVINSLKEKGYNSEGGKTNLMAAPYDWRLAPSTMEERDQYFTNTMNTIETLYNNNGSTPVVLLCHSLGTKVGHYLLNFALDKKGQNWIDEYIHTYMPVAAPHLGAPKGMRGLIAGDKMSLDTFLSDEEAIFLSRSLGSEAWMIPSDLPEGVPACNYILPHGVLEISIAHAVDTHELVKKRSAINRPNKYQLVISGKGFDGTRGKDSGKTIRSFFHRISGDRSDDIVVFKDKFSFATGMTPYHNETLQFLLQEPGLASAKKDDSGFQCNPLVYCLCCVCIPCILVYKVYEMLCCTILRGATLAVDAIAGSAGGSATLAFSEEIKIPKSVWSGKAVTIKVPIYHIDDYGQYEGCCMMYEKKRRQANLYVKLKWNTFNPKKSFRRLCSPLCRPSETAVQLPITTKTGEKYEEFSGYDVAEREGCESQLLFIKNKYDCDKYRPRNLSSRDPPPIKRIHAIYGVNIPTEVGCVYTRQDTCVSEKMLQSLYVPDKKAIIEKNTGYIVSGGVIMETPKTKQKVWGDIEVSGDGTIPYWSLAHVKTWQSEECKITIQELEKAPHREILGDPRFHEAVSDYCRVKD